MIRKQRTINIAIWIAQATLASTLLFSGYIKLSQPLIDVASIWQWTAQYPKMVRLVAIAEILLGIGIVIPELLRTAMRITVWAAYACITWTVCNMYILIIWDDWPSVGTNLTYLALATFIAWGRQNPNFTTPK